MERTNDVIWRPQPYIASSQNRVVGTPVNSRDMVQLSVPSTLGFAKNVTFSLDAKELRDALQENRLGASASQRLASDINTAINATASVFGGIVVTRTTAAGTFDDVALCDTTMNERGVPMEDRHIVFNSRDYNGMAGNLAARQNVVGKVLTAYDKAYINEVSGFSAYKSDTQYRLAATAVTSARTIDTRVTANNFYVPRATVDTVTGTNNVDNRFQTITVSSNANFAQGDAFTIAGVNTVHAITKQDTGQPFTVRVVSVGASNTLVITPPMITAQGGSDAELQYQNCVVVTTSATAAITMLNLDAAGTNVFWHKPAIELIAGRYAVPDNTGAAVMRATTDQGIELVMTKWFDTATFKTRFTFDTLFGTNVLNTEMAGILLFNQTP
jgi:6-pyruvoyl-tetrahydropterin synthase